MAYIPITNIAEFISYVNKKDDDFIWHGQSDFDWDLIPTSFRNLEEKLQDKTRTEKTDWRNKKSRPATKEESEEAKDIEERMLQLFKRQALPHLSQIPPHDDNWQWMSLARHHNLPTRLLDWTESAIIALFFAVDNLNNGGKDSAVYFCKSPTDAPEGKDPFDIDNIYLYRPHHIAARITVQRSCFTVHPTYYLTENFQWPTSIGIIKIHNANRDEIRNSLYKLGIRKSTLFPEPDFIAKEIAINHGFPY